MRFLLLCCLCCALAFPAAAQSAVVPEYVSSLFVINAQWQTLTATDTTLWSWYVPTTVYLRQVQVRAVTVEDTASFVLEGGTNFATTYATVAVNAAGVSYSNPTGGSQKILGGTTIRLRSVLQDTLYRVSANLLISRQ